MRLRDLQFGDRFKFHPGDRDVYEYRGNGWYGLPYSGGPWHCEGNPEVLDGQPEPQWLYSPAN
jgi:hypothetical protein